MRRELLLHPGEMELLRETVEGLRWTTAALARRADSEAIPAQPSPERVRDFIEPAAKYGYWLGSPHDNAAVGLAL
jgi:hypothetical protein